MKTCMLVILSFVCLTLHAQDPKISYKKIGATTIYDIPAKKIYVYKTKLSIDADGSPHAYHPVNVKGLDHIDNAGVPGNWWALVTDTRKTSGKPLIQKASDPAPGYYISMTRLEDPGKKEADPLRYVDAEKIPYIVLPRKFSNNFKLGGIALVVNTANGKRCFAIFADTGSEPGEGSIALANQLGIESNPRHGGADSGIVYILFKNSGTGKPLSVAAINLIGEERIKGIDIDKLIH